MRVLRIEVGKMNGFWRQFVGNLSSIRFHMEDGSIVTTEDLLTKSEEED